MLVGDSDSTCASPGAFAKSKSVKREVDHRTPTTIDQYYHWTVGMFPCSRFGVQYLHWFDRLRGVGCKSSGARGRLNIKLNNPETPGRWKRCQ